MTKISSTLLQKNLRILYHLQTFSHISFAKVHETNKWLDVSISDPHIAHNIVLAHSSSSKTPSNRSAKVEDQSDSSSTKGKAPV
ncbi:hypothetical protein L1987_17152 [Smallanthus sonchifolius]|uniref:Uncharacterized protein n=1 Tax=Smallanthus sonchifolius TaxID=185202 RepID=A0ACB9IXM9_9ASTR|nr:hypothetical protein L1987_17152 [Smallanthus sonchifolius]